MTRLSEALRRAAGNTASEPQPVMPPTNWQFAPVETMHVPEEPSPALAGNGHGEVPPAARRESESRDQLAAVPSLRPLQFAENDRKRMVIGDDVDAALVEQYRHLAAALHHAADSRGVRSVMVTSALPSEGKTLTATNLAITLSESYQRRVLLIDADLRRPRLREMFTLDAAAGLTDSLTMPSRASLPVTQVTPTLWVLTAGRVVPDPMSLLVSPAMKQLIEDARAAFDWVIVDTPPIAILPDANLLATMVDASLLVVSAESTPYPMVNRAVEAIDRKRILGVVLNRATTSSLPSNYGYYGYQKSHRSGVLPARTRWFGWLRRPHVQ